MTANKPSDAIPEAMKRRIKELERDRYNPEFLRCFYNGIEKIKDGERYAHANKVQAEELGELRARLAEARQETRDAIIEWDADREAWKARLAEAERLLREVDEWGKDYDGAWNTLDRIEDFLRPTVSTTGQESVKP